MMNAKSMKYIFWIGIACVFITHLPFLILGEASYVMTHDNLDSELVYLILLKMSNNLIGSSETGIVPNIFNGIHRDFFHSEFNVIRLLFYYLPAFWAYVLNSLIIRLLGFLGVFLLAKDYFKSSNQLNTLLIAVAFSCLQVHSIFGLCVMGQPLLLWSFLNLKTARKPWFSIAFICLFAFYSNFITTGPFVLIVLFFIGIYNRFIVKKTVHTYYWIGIFLLLTLFILADFSLFKNFFVGHEPYQKDAWKFFVPDLTQNIRRFVSVLVSGTMHTLHGSIFPIFALLAYAAIKRAPVFKPASLVMILIISIVTFFVFYRNITVPLEEHFHLITAFNFSRFIFLIPFSYTLILLIINQEKKLSSSLVLILTMAYATSVAFKNTELKVNAAKIMLPAKFTKNYLSFESFFATQLYDDIHKYINKPKDSYRVVSLGVQPSIAQYNGFYTLDAYQNLYPLSYKNTFREIIKGEIDKDAKFQKFWDNHGTNMCYIISSELIDNCHFNCKKEEQIVVKSLSINVNKLRDMNAQYLFSAVPILNADDLGLQKERVFENKIAGWKIHLYSL